MLMMLNACESRGFASTSTLTTSTLPSYFAASFSISGATILQGPHHTAQKSTTVGRSDLRTSSSNVSSVTCLISAIDVPPPALAGDVLDKSVRLEDTVVRKSIEDGVAVTPAGHETRSAEHSEVLAHVGDLAADPGAEVADRELTDGERLEDAQALGIREGSTDGGVALAIGLGGDWQVIQHCRH